MGRQKMRLPLLPTPNKSSSSQRAFLCCSSRGGRHHSRYPGCWLVPTRMQRGCMMYGFSSAVPSHLPTFPESYCSSSLFTTTTPNPHYFLSPPTVRMQPSRPQPHNGKSASVVFIPPVTPHLLISERMKSISYPQAPSVKLGSQKV
jgi:hypothetical protein